MAYHIINLTFLRFYYTIFIKCTQIVDNHANKTTILSQLSRLHSKLDTTINGFNLNNCIHNQPVECIQRLLYLEKFARQVIMNMHYIYLLYNLPSYFQCFRNSNANALCQMNFFSINLLEIVHEIRKLYLITFHYYSSNFPYDSASVLDFFGTYAHALEARDYFIDMTTKTFEHRERHNVIRKDFIQLMLQLRNAGKVSEDNDDWKVQHSGAGRSLTIEQCAAQSYLFYLAGFDTTASALAYTLFELVRNRDLLQRLQREIDETLRRHGGEITYEAIMEMQFLELCMLGEWGSLPRQLISHSHPHTHHRQTHTHKQYSQKRCANIRHCRC